MDQTYLVAEFARRAGVTVRALHHYDRLGLLRPSGRGRNGYRRYSDADLVRLQHIVTLKALGFELDAIAPIVDAPAFDPAAALRAQILVLEDRRRSLDAALHVLRLAERGATADGVIAWDSLVRIIEAMNAMQEIDPAKHFSREQLEELRRRDLDPDERARVSERWNALFADIDAARDEAPESARAQALLARWDALVAEFTGGDAGIARSLDSLYADPENRAKAAAAQPGLPQAAAFIERARAARR